MPDDPFRQAAGQSPLGFGEGDDPTDRLGIGNPGHDLPHPIGLAGGGESPEIRRRVREPLACRYLSFLSAIVVN